MLPQIRVKTKKLYLISNKRFMTYIIFVIKTSCPTLNLFRPLLCALEYYAKIVIKKNSTYGYNVY